MRYRKKTDSFEVPPSAGTAGLLEVVRGVLGLRGVQHIEINNKGVVTYQRMVPKDAPDEDPLGLDLSTVTPNAVMRRSLIKEIVFQEGENASETVCKCFMVARIDGVVPICFATGAATLLWKWFKLRTGITADLPQDEFFGQALRYDQNLPNEVLILFAGYERSAALVDATHTYKIPLVMQ